MHTNTISILGCGWLGLPLAERLIEENYFIKGSTTRPEKLEKLAQKGILPYLVQLAGDTLQHADTDFFQTDVCILSFTPSGSGKTPESYIEAMQAIKSQLPLGSKVLLVSSTSVYPDLDREVTEADVTQPAAAGNKAIAAAEEVWFKAHAEGSHQATIVRCAGLMGYNRVPGKYFSGKTNVPGANTPVNLIHRDDVVEILLQLVKRELWGEVFNLVTNDHPVKRDLYRKNAAMFGFAEPQYDEAQANPTFKIVSNKKLIAKTGYIFKYPSPMDFTYDQ